MITFSQIWDKLKGVFKKMIGNKTIEQELHVMPMISTEMEDAIELWSDMYRNKAPWLKEPTYKDPTRIVSLGLPSMIASEKARMAVLEFESEITAPTKKIRVKNTGFKMPENTESLENFPGSDLTFKPLAFDEEKPTGPTERAEYLNKQYEKLKQQLRKQLEYAVAKGGIVIKPYVIQNPVDNSYEIDFDFIQADNFYPLAFNASGKITEAAFLDTKFEKDLVYRRLEYHKWEGKSVKVINKVYRSTNTQIQNDYSSVDLGEEVPLSSVYEWKDLSPETTIEDIDQPLFVYFRMPQANTIDTLSPLGVSGYARAVQLIKDADTQYSRLLWEYEAGEMAIDIDRDALNFQEDEKGGNHSVLGTLQQRLYRKIDLGGSGDTYEPYAPTLRDSSLIQGLNTILMRIEDVCAISRGTISDVTSEARTATELKILKQRTYSENREIQKALENSLKDVIYIMNAYCDLYNITPKGEYDVSFEWDDSILVDSQTELGKRLTLLQEGIVSKLEIRQWYFGETKRQAKEALLYVSEESQQAMEENMILNQQLGGIVQNNKDANKIEEEGDADDVLNSNNKDDKDKKSGNSNSNSNKKLKET